LDRERPKIVVDLYEAFAKFSKPESCTSASLSNKEKYPSMMKPQGHPATTIISATTPSKCTTSISMVVGLQKTWRRILNHPYKKEVREPLIIDQISTLSEGAC
jgi:hypothetical protein